MQSNNNKNCSFFFLFVVVVVQQRMRLLGIHGAQKRWKLPISFFFFFRKMIKKKKKAGAPPARIAIQIEKGTVTKTHLKTGER